MLKGVFGRKVSVIVGVASTGVSIDISDLHIMFTVKSGRGVDKTAVLTVFNLSKETLTAVNSSLDDSFITITAGYSEGNPARKLFDGRVTGITPLNVGADIQYSLNCVGSPTRKFEVVSKKYPEATSASTIINDLAKDLGMDTEYHPAVALKLGLKLYAGGYTVYGSAFKTILDIANDVSSEVAIEGNIIKFFSNSEGNTIRVVFLTKETGLLEGLKEGKKSTDTAKTFTCKSILMPELNRGSKVNIDDGFISGTFKVVGVTHKGSNFGDDYSTNLEVEQL